MSSDRFLGIDIGLTFTKATVIDAAGTVLGSAEERHTDVLDGLYRAVDPDAVWLEETRRTARRVLQATASSRIAGICVCGPWPSVVVLGADGRCLLPAILLDDGRFDAELEEVRALLPDPAVGYELLPRLLWLKRNLEEQWSATSLILSSQNFVIYRLTGQSVIDIQTAKAYGCYDAETGGWDEAQLALLGLDDWPLPAIHRPLDMAGVLHEREARAWGLAESAPVIVGTGDSFASLVAAGATDPGDDFVYCGTFGLCATLASGIDEVLGGSRTDNSHGLMWRLSLPNFGVHLDSLIALILGREPRDAVDYAEAEQRVAALLPPNVEPRYRFYHRDLAVPPSLRFKPLAAIEDLPMRFTGAELVMAALRTFCAQSAFAFRSENGRAVSERPLKVTGGGSRNAVWMQLLADMSGRQVRVPRVSGAQGAARLACAAFGGRDLGFDAAYDTAQFAVFEPDPAMSALYADQIAASIHE